MAGCRAASYAPLSTQHALDVICIHVYLSETVLFYCQTEGASAGQSDETATHLMEFPPGCKLLREALPVRVVVFHFGFGRSVAFKSLVCCDAFLALIGDLKCNSECYQFFRLTLTSPQDNLFP